tara:strand:- start:3134 stop:3301 length:168 start_codon:yes stop_codon:yes gene_type:complete
MAQPYQTDLFLEGLFAALLRQDHSTDEAFRIVIENPALPNLSRTIRQVRLQRHLL